MKTRSKALSGCCALLIVSFFASCVPSAHSQEAKTSAKKTEKSAAEFKDASFRSESLQKEMRYRVLLPRGYRSSAKRYPTLYLLHGLYGDYLNWSTRTNLAKWADDLELIIVMPDAGNSWYVNSATNASEKFEDYIVEDFVDEVDSHFRTIRDRRSRAIAGLSMGGYAAVNFSLKHLDLFSYCGAISAALDAPGGLDERKPEFREGLEKAFGRHESETRSANDVFAEVSTSNPEKFPYIFIDCGEDDMFLLTNRELAGELQRKKAHYEYHEFPGDHTWEYWDHSIHRFLIVLASARFTESRTR